MTAWKCLTCRFIWRVKVRHERIDRLGQHVRFVECENEGYVEVAMNPPATS